MLRLSSALALSLCTACAAPKPAPESAPPAQPETTVTVTKEEIAPEAPKEPTAEELAAEKQRAAMQAERAQMEADHQAELLRLTPEVKSAALAVFDKKYGSTRAALTEVLKAPHRKPGHVERDAQRHPRETLEFLGLKPTMTVLEYGPGEGWYTELLAPTLYKQGKLLATNGNPNGPAEQRSTMYAQRFQWFLDSAPELYNKVQTVTVDSAHPALPEGTQVDQVLVFRGLHGMVNAGTLNDWLTQFHTALKPKGILGIEQHRANADAVAVDSAKKGYLPEAWVIAQIEAAGFKLQGKSEINKNPKDTKDYPEGVWALPPTYRLGDQDREKYTAIGESDRMTLRFVKVEKKAAAAPAPAASEPAP